MNKGAHGGGGGGGGSRCVDGLDGSPELTKFPNG
jgi:hypothetical protein